MVLRPYAAALFTDIVSISCREGEEETDLVVDFKVVLVCEVENSSAMEKMGFIDTLNSIEAVGVDVAHISTDSDPQIKNYT